ncbi:hypothetical protein N9092_03760 [Akkermansiaceae bacterium]|nr:hypothetical protein [Akkermansiaceae bacterium]
MKLRSIRSSFHRLRFFCTVLATFSAAGVVSGQEGAASLPELPSGFYEFTAGVINEEEEQRLGNLDLSLSLSTLYDTNVTQGNELGPRPEESDFLVQPTLAGSYKIGPGNWRIGATGSLSKMNYLKTDIFNSTVYSARLLGQYEMGKVNASLETGYASDAGVNRLAGAFIEQKNFSNSAKVNYRLSSKTSAEILWTQESTEVETDGFTDISSNTVLAAALWQATPLLRLGPGFRYGVRTAAFQDAELTVAGPLLRASYNFSAKVDLTSAVGLDFADSPSGENELLNWRVGLKYRASALWGLKLNMVRDTQATLLGGGGFDQISSYGFAYTRRIHRASLQLGFAYVDRDPQGSAGAALAFRDSTSLDYTASLGFPIIGDEVDLNINLAWRDFTTAEILESWDGFQSGLSLAWRF